MTLRNRCRIAITVLLTGTAITAYGETKNCEINNAALKTMHKSLVTVTRADGTAMEFEVKTADTLETRAAGFQRVCQSTITAEPIIFLFESQVQPRFHMNNVVAPIDIAFIDAKGYIVSMHAMKPYVLGSKSRPTYGPEKPVVAALEVHQGFFARHHISADSIVSWRVLQ